MHTWLFIAIPAAGLSGVLLWTAAMSKYDKRTIERWFRGQGDDAVSVARRDFHHGTIIWKNRYGCRSYFVVTRHRHLWVHFPIFGNMRVQDEAKLL